MKIPRHHRSSIEPLEARIAPATIAGNVLAYQDIDGDLVKVSFSKPIAAANFTFNTAMFADPGPQQLQLIDLLDQTMAFAGVSITATVTKAGAGDGLVAIGRIDGTSIDVGKVTIKGDLGSIAAGDADMTTPALLALATRTLGRHGLASQMAGGTLSSLILGPLLSLTVSGDVKDVFINLVGKIGSIKIGGSLIGGPTANAGEIDASGDIGSVKVGRDVIGGTGTNAGQISSGGAMGPVTLGGSLLAGAEGKGGVIKALSLGAVKIGGDIVGGVGENSGFLRALGDGIASLTVGGSVIGGGGKESGTVICTGTLGALKIGKDVRGGGGTSSGTIAGTEMGTVTLGGSLLGGKGVNSGEIGGATKVGAVKIAGDVAGGEGSGSGVLISNGTLASVTLGGSIIGGANTETGRVVSVGDLGPVKIGRNIVGGSGQISGQIATATGGDIASVTVGGSILAGSYKLDVNPKASQPGILSRGNLGPVSVKGSIIGTESSNVLIAASGDLTVPAGATTNVAIKSVTVGGTVDRALILAGTDANLVVVNGHVQIGAIKVGGDWIASSVSAGVADTNSDGFGGADDMEAATGPAGIISRIASITIKGTLIGTAATTDGFGFVAHEIGAFQYGGTKVPLVAGTFDAPIFVSLVTADVTIREV